MFNFLNAHVSFSILMFTSCICLIVLTVFVVKLIISVIQLANNTNDIAQSVQKEIEPTLKELKETMKSINSIAGSADSQLQSTKVSIASLIGTAGCFGGKLKSFAQGIMKGISFGLKLFKK